MLKQSILIVSTALFFSACSLKMPTFEMPSFLSFSKDSTKDLEEAFVFYTYCQKLHKKVNNITKMSTRTGLVDDKVGNKLYFRPRI